MMCMTRYAEHVNDLRTPQSQPARADQVPNSAGGHVFAVDKWSRLDRFLVLGAEGGTYYVDERKLTVDNAACVRECLAEDGARTVARIVAVSDAGRAPRNDPAIFALAMAAGSESAATRALALSAVPKVCRIGTHLFHFANDVQGFRGWGPALRKTISRWYVDRPVDKLALQAIKYQQRDGWSHRDLLRLAHPEASTPEQNAVLAWMRGPASPRQSVKHARKDRGTAELPAIVRAFEEIHSPGLGPARAVALVAEHRLPHECVPNELKAMPEIWEALLPHMGITALIRNLGKMTSVGLLKPMGISTKLAAARLTDASNLFAGRVHPISVLLALKTYASGHGLKGSLSWGPVREIVDALDEAFYLSFQAIEPTGKRFMLALDVSGSMSDTISGTSLQCREASAAMAMATARSEKNWYLAGFTSGGSGYGGQWGGAPSKLTPIPISARSRLDDAVRACAELPMGRTDCALPMLHATAEKLEVDTFVIYTDNETWAGRIHPFQALRDYRNRSGIAARLVVVGMTAMGFTIADPTDAGMLDVAGFDAAVPGVIADFAAVREVVR
jgi:60 kDa SS-A/Ro ribonucleoprotein